MCGVALIGLMRVGWGRAKCFMRIATANVKVEIGTFRVSPQQLMVGLDRNGGVLIRGSVAELHVKNFAMTIIGHVGQR
jgi:hypothetical protein